MADTWCVVALTRNSPDDFRRFVAWYLELGASRIHLYFHDPDDPNIALVEQDERFVVNRVSDELLNELNADRERLSQLQDLIGTHAYDRTDTDWILRVDVDELLYPGKDRSVSDLLGELPKEILTLLFEPAEHIIGKKSDGQLRFRSVMSSETLEAVYGAFADLVRSRMGLIGHRMGKSISRTGIEGFQIRTHVGRYPERSTIVKRPRAVSRFGSYLLHFNAVNYETWRDTIGYRVQYSSFDPRLASELKAILISKVDTDAKLKEVFSAINEIDDAKFATLERNGVGFSLSLDLDGIVERHFPKS